eukprot:CAMPEP_0197063774 /NCGR_PEP_ID=MMETSP1384-20130603/154655_1 /TAXON_ID=29189 /ORGANISM="Ammonia sp." /LENGTH=56 /DNA_ID=CAMNT_0042500099 /DNA_START=18 /DNA_END=185 /DNA_ORIENTATION=-
MKEGSHERHVLLELVDEEEEDDGNVDGFDRVDDDAKPEERVIDWQQPLLHGAYLAL